MQVAEFTALAQLPELDLFGYSPAQCMGARRAVISGKPDHRHVSTSMVERQNLTMRMSMRVSRALQMNFPKKVENHEHMIAVHYMFYNFGRIHQTLRVTLAMEAGVSDHVWELGRDYSIARLGNDMDKIRRTTKRPDYLH